MASAFRTAVFSGLAALAFGGLLGTATISGVQPRAAEAAPIYPRAAPLAEAPDRIADTGCPGCTRYDEGYRWASLNSVTETDACFGEDWSRQSGCLAYVRASRLE